MKYLLDSNVFIQAYKQFYDKEIVPIFWEKLSNYIKDHEFVIVDKVYNELTSMDTGLGNWIKEQTKIVKYSTSEIEVLKIYNDVMNKVKELPYYNEEAYKLWDNNNVADPWIIAVAIKERATIVTHETIAYGGKSQNYKKLKIPDVALLFDVKCINLFKYMKEEKIILK